MNTKESVLINYERFENALKNAHLRGKWRNRQVAASVRIVTPLQGLWCIRKMNGKLYKLYLFAFIKCYVIIFWFIYWISHRLHSQSLACIFITAASQDFSHKWASIHRFSIYSFHLSTLFHSIVVDNLDWFDFMTLSLTSFFIVSLMFDMHFWSNCCTFYPVNSIYMCLNVLINREDFFILPFKNLKILQDLCMCVWV